MWGEWGKGKVREKGKRGNRGDSKLFGAYVTFCPKVPPLIANGFDIHSFVTEHHLAIFNMASASTACISCLRRVRAATSKNTFPSPHLLRIHQSRAFRISTAATPHQPLFLDFLAPSILTLPQKSSMAISSPLISFRRTQFPRFVTTAAHSTKPAAESAPPQQTTPARAIQNPRTSENGTSMLISLTPRASSRLSAIAMTDNNPNLALRVTVESGGCHGFQYLMSLVDLSTSPPTEEDTVFEGDKAAKVVIDEPSLELLNGSTIDYTMELIGSQFKVTGIPGATSSCGCGSSFDIKI
ncbi:uncharacterized protein BDR25DRAFT_352863 [Lindgomyces ingoldianus]|uniref:Uncharacterized protein n=1 Tax=Lindgomyces ingoldianus TaxID=673940 RepID=A0ACB6R4J1_9PLEO|nr:uncharacterized protein BDR25DRAFT_352863 [Lindgomyces ingoldianus]KAF2473442.1 hypothetical protein BDR25DRAFT_352863 [Lindgomyces ingoldianus]